MARVYWKGAAGTARQPGSGDFGGATNWLGGAAPTEADDAFLAAGDYTLTVYDGADEVRSITVGAGATLSVTGPNSNYNVLYVNAQSINYGTFDLRGGVFWNLSADEPLINYGAIQGVRSGQFGGVIEGGPVENLGFMGTGIETGQLACTSDVHNVAGAEIGAHTGTVYLGGVLDNDGLVGAYGQLVTFAESSIRGSASNFASNGLRGGAWEMLAGGSIVLNDGGVIAELLDGADVTLGAATSFVAHQDDGSSVAIERSLRTIGAGAALRLVDGRAFESAHPLDVGGTLTLAGASVSADELRLAKGALLTGFGSIDASTRVDGHVIVHGGRGPTGQLTLIGDSHFAGLATGAGTLSFFDGDSVIEAGARIRTRGLALVGQDVRLDATLNYAGTLTLDSTRLDIHADTLRAGKLAHVADSVITGDRATLTFAHGATLYGLCDIGVAVLAHGKMTVGGQVEFARDVSGSADYLVGRGDTLTFDHAVAAQSSVTLVGIGGRLELGDPAAFHAHLLKFGARDTIALAGVDAGSRLSWRADADGVGGTLFVFDPDGRIGLRFDDGSYAGSGFHLHAEAGGASSLTYAAPPPGAPVLDAALFGGAEPFHPLDTQLV